LQSAAERKFTMSRLVSPERRRKFSTRTLQSRLSSARPWLAAAFLFAITFLAYLPAIRNGGFIWDDKPYITDNPLLLSIRGLWSIWTKVGPAHGGTPQYYPLTFSIFWIEHHLFQLHSPGYHLVNILLHAANALFVWRILRRLCVPGALLAAAIFAVHPVCVESVAWISELKNILSGLFYLSSLLCYLKFLGFKYPVPQTSGESSFRSGETQTHPAPAEPHDQHWPFYFLSIFLFCCALGSKSITASLPAGILLILWWKNGRIGWKKLLLLSPMLIPGAGLGLITAIIERYQVGASGADWVLTPVQHLLVAGRILWFYAGKLIWPVKLMFIYPRWKIDQTIWWQYLFPLAAAAVVISLWSVRKKTGRGLLTAVLFFAVTLAPALAFLNVYPMRFSYVADHFQYLASLAPIALFSAGATRGLSWLRSRADPDLTRIAIFFSGALLLALGLLTWRQVKIYGNSDQIWRDTIKKNPDCWLAHGYLGLSLLEQGKLDEAIAQYREALRIYPDYFVGHVNCASALAGEGKFQEAIVEYRELLRLNPDYPEAHYGWGLALAGLGELKEAIPHYREALRLKPDYPEVQQSWGIALARQGKIQETIMHYHKALQLRPDYPEAHNNLGVVLAGLGKVKEAIAQYREALRLRPDYPEAHMNWGIDLDEQGKVEDAIVQYREALRLRPAYAEAHYNLGLDLSKQGKLQEAAAQYRETLFFEPDCVEAHNTLGVLLAGQGKVEEAIAQYREALRLKPDFIEAHYGLGWALGTQDKTEEAIAQFREALRLKPEYADGHCYLGVTLQTQGKTEEAIAQYLEALRLKPNYPEVHDHLGVALEEQGKADEAIMQYREAVRIKPDFADALNNWGIALDGQGKVEEAIAQYREALRLNPDFVAAHYNLGVDLAGQDNTEEAIAQYREALRLAPDYTEARDRLETALAAQGKSSELIKR
jgi:tetratricopeptide (TPR) repeat protein